MRKQSLILLFFILVVAGCKQKQSSNSNPAAKGFNAKASDPKAIAIADSVMKAMGGRKNWDQTKIIHWNFFGQRAHTWDKATGKDSIYIPSKNMAIVENIHSKKGKVFENGKQMTQPDSVKKYLTKGYQWWVNDSYWLFMPFKMKDTGVTLKYLGIHKTQAGEPAYKLQLTFDSVGVTPQNKFWVYVDTSDHLVRQWAYFPKASMSKPAFVLPWKNYKKHGKILLSGDRGKHTLSNIKVMNHWPNK
ncbi:MAG TPA: hypothetical protein VE868_10705 [Balneolaceae bacterium]|nr:hypothetical protein [Balneolaceae bacterium]